MEITTVVSKKRDMLELGPGRANYKPKREQKGKIELNAKSLTKLKKASRGKHACT